MVPFRILGRILYRISTRVYIYIYTVVYLNDKLIYLVKQSYEKHFLRKKIPLSPNNSQLRLTLGLTITFNGKLN